MIRVIGDFWCRFYRGIAFDLIQGVRCADFYQGRPPKTDFKVSLEGLVAVKR